MDPGLCAKLGLMAQGSGDAATGTVGLVAFKRIVAHDLTQLLNTRCHLEPADGAGERQVARSVLGFGVEDFSARYIESACDVADICRSLGQAVQRFEPRLQQVQVLVDPDTRSVAALGLRIQGLLVAPGVREPVRFQAVFDILTKRCALTPLY